MQIHSLAERPDLVERFWDVEGDWPTFMLHDPVAANRYKPAVELFPDLHLLALEDGAVVARIHAVPICWPGADQLPDRGWDWALESAVDRPTGGDRRGLVSWLVPVTGSRTPTEIPNQYDEMETRHTEKRAQHLANSTRAHRRLQNPTTPGPSRAHPTDQQEPPAYPAPPYQLLSNNLSIYPCLACGIWIGPSGRFQDIPYDTRQSSAIITKVFPPLSSTST